MTLTVTYDHKGRTVKAHFPDNKDVAIRKPASFWFDLLDVLTALSVGDLYDPSYVNSIMDDLAKPLLAEAEGLEDLGEL